MIGTLPCRSQGVELRLNLCVAVSASYKRVMGYRALADAVVLVHAAFVLFVVLGGLLVLRWRRVACVHLPAAAWGVLIEFSGGVCPLTPLENWLRERAGDVGYANSFVEQYVVPTLYPAMLTRNTQFVLGMFVLGVNAGIYRRVIHRQG
jgi:hypothetical protein